MLVLVMVLSAVPFGVFAEGETPDAGTGEPAAVAPAEGQNEEKETPKTEGSKTEGTGTPDTANVEKGETPKAEDEGTPDLEENESPKEDASNPEKKTAVQEAPQDGGENQPVVQTGEDTSACTCRDKFCRNEEYVNRNGCTVCMDAYYDTKNAGGDALAAVGAICKGTKPDANMCICDKKCSEESKNTNCALCDSDWANCKSGSSVIITYHPNYEGAETNTENVPYGRNYGHFADHPLIREGYVFTGWYVDAACTQPVPQNATALENVTIYAGWVKAKTISVTITVDGKPYTGKCDVHAVNRENENYSTFIFGGQNDTGSFTLSVAPGVYAVELAITLNGSRIVYSQDVDVTKENKAVTWNYKNPELKVNFTGTGKFENATLLNGTEVAQSLTQNGKYSVTLNVTAAEANGTLTLTVRAKVGSEDETDVTTAAVNLRIPYEASTKQFTIKNGTYELPSHKPTADIPYQEYYTIDGNDLMLWSATAGTYTIESQNAEFITISFNANAGGEDVKLPNPIRVVKGSRYAVSDPWLAYGKLERTGYSFLGWSLDGKDVLVPATELATNDDVVLYAVWHAKTISLDHAHDGKVTERTIKELKQGDPLPAPEPWEDHVFRGWYNYEGEKVETADYSDELSDLTARWTEVVVSTIDGVSIPTPSAAALDKIIASSKEAQTVTLACNGNVNESDKAAIEAQAGVNAAYYDLSVMVDGQKQSDLGASLVFEVRSEEKNPVVYRKHGNAAPEKMAKLSDKPADGSSVEGYYVEGSTILIYTHSFSTYAVAEAETVTITYHDGTTGTSNKDVTVSVKKGEKFQPSAMPDGWTKTGYSLERWVAEADGQTTQEYKLTEQYEVTENKTLTAVWKPITYTVTFDGNGGTLTGTNPVNATYDVAVTAPDAARNYYKCLGWATKADAQKPDYADGTELKNLTAQNGGNVKLYAIWSYVPRDITLDAKGGTLTDANGKDVKTLTVRTTAARDENGKDYNVLTAASLQTPAAPEGKTFAGWYTTEDNKGVQIEANDIIPDSVTTLYAHWNDFQSVDVTLKAMGGTMKLDGKTVREGKIATKWPGVLSQTLPTPARTGYKFLGWYTADGDKVDQNTRYTGTTNVIYAHWERAVSRTGNPKTGDQVRLGLAAGILAVAAVGLTTAAVLRKRKK